MRIGDFREKGWLGLLTLAALVSLACGRPAPASSEARADISAVDAVPQRRDADDTSRFLAGMPGREGSPFRELENSPSWKEHRRVMDDAWNSTEGGLIAGLGAFQKQELAGTSLASAPVFYPFGGPDALTPLQFFPGTRTYVMVALEPPGSLP